MSTPRLPAQRAARIINTDRIANDQSFTRFYAEVPIASYSTSRRLLTERPKLSVDALASIAERFAPKLQMTSREFIDALFCQGANVDRRIAERLFATPWPGKPRLLKQFAHFLICRIAAAREKLHFAHFPPPWSTPPSLSLF